MRENEKLTSNVDWLLLIAYFVILTMGVMTVYSTGYDKETSSFFNFTGLYGKQVMWICISLFLGLLVFLIDSEIYRKFSIPIYIFTLLLLIVVLFTPPINGARAWLGIGPFGIQPAEFAKIGTAILLASYVDKINIRQQTMTNVLICLAIIAIPMMFIILQPDAGTFVVFTAFFFVLYREGVTFDPLVLTFINMFPGMKFKKTWIGTHFIPLLFVLVFISVFTLFMSKTTFDIASLGFYEIPSVVVIIFSYFIIALLFYLIGRNFVDSRSRKKFVIVILLTFSLFSLLSASISTVFNSLQKHQKNRIELLLDLNEEDQRDGEDYNRNRAMTAVGSGGLLGKGYNKATLSSVKSKHVPESETDFIFCPFAEEWGFVGTAVLMGLYLFFLLRIINIAERQRSTYNRVYAYSVGMILFYHFAINIGMNIGLVPIIGIPLPFFSYGGSSMMSFSVMFFILLKLDSQRRDTLF
ncbi:MAG: rod shape-determining protein RodA [Crocinitomicaceae bacterium]|nr:rod shape-determining protein RodA [Crocinitomicaceae bacterium]